MAKARGLQLTPRTALASGIACLNRLKQWRGLATRYEKRAANYRGMVVIASIAIWLQA
jgi:transposase